VLTAIVHVSVSLHSVAEDSALHRQSAAKLVNVAGPLAPAARQFVGAGMQRASLVIPTLHQLFASQFTFELALLHLHASSFFRVPSV
jgi:hypothetical protein